MRFHKLNFKSCDKIICKRLSTFFGLILHMDAVYQSFQRWPRCNSFEEEREQKQNNSWQRIGARTTKMHLLPPAYRFRE